MNESPSRGAAVASDTLRCHEQPSNDDREVFMTKPRTSRSSARRSLPGVTNVHSFAAFTYLGSCVLPLALRGVGQRIARVGLISQLAGAFVSAGVSAGSSACGACVGVFVGPCRASDSNDGPTH